MYGPTISILFPVFNAAKFLSFSIESILNQTFQDFELIIINDGSIDESENIIRSYKDHRIIYVKNDINKGLVYSLNKGIELAKGKYIARMDADDIALPMRFEIQNEFLDSQSQIGVVASTINFINEKNEIIGFWRLDQKTLTPEKIRKKMLKESCIAHPSIMGRSEIFKTYMYKDYQKNIEDYDLWLRLLNDKIIIAKINNPLLLYRIHNASITKKDHKKENVFFKIARCKSKFVSNEVTAGKFSLFVLCVFFYSIIDLVKGLAKTVKKSFVAR